MNMKKGYFKLSTLTLALLSTSNAFNAFAQEVQEEKMVVVSSHLPKALSDISGTVWYVDSELIEQEYRGGKNLDEILATAVPSLDVASGGRTHSGQNLRGRSMMVMIDGVSLQSVRSISRQLDSIDPFNIERIEVLSGATSLYGAGASGGVINIITKKGTDSGREFESFVGGTSGFSSNQDLDYKLAQSVAFGNEKAQGRVAVAYTKNQGYYDTHGDIITPDITQGSTQFNETVDLMTNAQVNLTAGQQLNILTQYYESQQDSPYGLYFEKDDEGKFQFVDVRKGYSSPRQQGTQRFMLSTTYSNDDFFNYQLMSELSFRTEDHTFSPYTSSGKNNLKTSSSNQVSDILAFKLALNRSFNDLSLTFGIDSYLDEFESNNAIYDQSTTESSGGLIHVIDHMEGRYPGVETRALASFIQSEYSISDRWSVQAGVRYQYIHTTISDFQKSTNSDFVPGGSTDYSELLFNLGTMYDLTPDSQLWANFSQGFDLPNAAKYYGKDANSRVSNSKLEGITTDSYEIGYRTNIDDLEFQSAAYYSYTDATILYTDEFTIKGLSKPKRVYGIEAQAKYWATDNLLIGASGNYVRTQEKGDHGWDDFKAMEASTSKTNTWIGWYDHDYSLKLQSQTMFDYEDASDRKLNGYTVVDLIGNYQLPIGNLGFGIQNVLNEDYSTIWSQRAKYWYGNSAMFDYKGRGRTFTLNYQVKF
ncbi:TonB-dependent receptor [Vibrio sagamiensis]|uniref:Ferric aerobactin receptor IutA n=1 Tax=Vibrio sagamiensis NBRC 104589 TaxID=1219064 RepID=A0A511QBJ1_9VIBR|nr:TonB-dependent receptor [Vibrio sagamiensis]PNQ64539.1 TonB-dependent receptor [Vibrio agarivorans]GEM74665.1 ferric aerobactin receptor precursor IutA [Vibrio sagamiensis NBRC 104589]